MNNRPKGWDQVVELARILLEFEIEQQQAAAAESLDSSPATAAETESGKPKRQRKSTPTARAGQKPGGRR